MPIDFNDYYIHQALKTVNGEPTLDIDAINRRIPGVHIFHYAPDMWPDGIRKNSCWTTLETDVPFYVNETTGMGDDRITWRARWVFPFADAEKLLKNMVMPNRRWMCWEYNNRLDVPANQLEWVRIA